jgi:Protein of unknown function (DUF2877)
MMARALFAGPGAVRALRAGRRGVVELVLSGGVYVRSEEDWLFFADPDAPFGPLSVAVIGLRRSALRPREAVSVERDRLWLGGLAVSLERLRERRPTPNLPRSRAPAATEAAAAAALAVSPGPPEALEHGLLALRRGRTREGVLRLAGRGDGLTPAGDDALAGYAAWRHVSGAPAGLSPLAADRSSPLGHAYLRCAERGELPDAGAAVLTAISAGDPQAAATAAIALSNWGASSGAALLWGIAAGATPDPSGNQCEHMFAMAYPGYVREKARQLRVERRLSIVEIAERLALPKTTVFYWVRDIPLGRPRRDNPHPGTRAMQRKFRSLREQAYKDGRESFETLSSGDPTFRDFVCMYIGEGYKRSRNQVSVANADPRVVVLATRWLKAMSRSKLIFSVQYHADQDVRQLSEFWASTLDISPGDVRLQPKANSGQLRSRVWRCKYGVLAVTTNDTLLRAQLQAWMDCVQEQWLHSPANGA